MRPERTRRDFLRRAAAGGLGLLVLRDPRSARAYAENGRLGMALIGAGGRGRWFVDTIPQRERLVALCDVNEERAAESYRKLPDAPKFRDYRKMLDELGRSIDAVIIAAPDHIHAPATARALRMGKPVYCEKPLTNSVRDARAVRDLARSRKLATQMGNQGTASAPFREAAEIVRAGLLGEIREVHVWNDAGGPDHEKAPEGSEPVPPHLAWDLWLGPSAFRPYHPAWLQWHGWRDFGTGNLGNWASHTANLAFFALEVASLWKPSEGPARTIRIEAKVSRRNRLSYPRWELVRWEVPARGALPPVRITWHNGQGAGTRAQIEDLLGDEIDWGDKKEKKWKDFAGLLLVGTKAKLHATGHNATYRLLPEAEFKDFKPPPRTLPRSPGHEQEWIDACRGGPPAMSNFEYSGPLAEFLLLGNAATQFEGPLEFDPVACKVTNDPDADRSLSREHRDGWEV